MGRCRSHNDCIERALLLQASMPVAVFQFDVAQSEFAQP